MHRMFPISHMPPISETATLHSQEIKAHQYIFVTHLCITKCRSDLETLLAQLTSEMNKEF